jgi:hypothetical protein
MAIIALPDAGYLHECFSYDPASGDFRWKERPRHHFLTNNAFSAWNARWSGKIAGRTRRQISLDSRDFLCSRIIWKMMTGTDPPALVDHQNNKAPLDNKWENLRSATRPQNNTNRRVTNSLGIKGVSQKKNRFRAMVRSAGKRNHLGYFDTAEEAHAAYCKAARELHGEFWNPG